MRYVHILCFCTFVCCTNYNSSDPLFRALDSGSPYIKNVIDNIVAYYVQIKLSTIDRINNVVFKDYKFQVETNNYFYPVSSVKFPVSVLILEKLNQKGLHNIDTMLCLEGDTLSTTFRHEIEHILQ